MSDNLEYTVELKEEQYEFLKKIAEKYSLQDESKAIRCLIDFARQESDQEKAIFEEIRCLHC